MTDALYRQLALQHLQQRVDELDARDAEIMLQLAAARTERESRRLFDDLRDVRFRRVFQKAILNDFKEKHGL